MSKKAEIKQDPPTEEEILVRCKPGKPQNISEPEVEDVEMVHNLKVHALWPVPEDTKKYKGVKFTKVRLIFV